MAVKTMDDIEREKQKEKRDRMRKDVSEDINEVIGNINILKKKKNKRSVIGWIVFIILIVLGLIIFTNIVLGNIWLLKFLIKSLFFNG